MKSWKKEQKVFVILLIITLALGTFNLAKTKGWLIPEQPELTIIENTVHLDTMTLEQKIAQMVVGIGHRDNLVAWRNMQIGGIYLYSLGNFHIFNNTIIDFQYEMPIPFFITVDLEGCFNPFANFKNFSSAADVDTLGEAFEKGYKEGEFLNHMGVNLNFAPVVDLDDQIWKCRNFPGDEEWISEMAQAYTLGLQTQDVIATAKHYPGKTLVVKDPHKHLVAAEIVDEDIFPYKYLANKGDVKAIMVSHIITSGEVESEGVPSVVSEKVIGELREYYDGLIVSDEIHMLGLKNFYEDIDDMYVAVFKAGNDVILNFDKDPNEVYRMIQVIVKAVEDGEISEKQIDDSVTRILKAKNFKVN